MNTYSYSIFSTVKLVCYVKYKQHATVILVKSIHYISFQDLTDCLLLVSVGQPIKYVRI
jgi:hypothetical protein